MSDMKNFQKRLLANKARDLVIRECNAGRGRWSQLKRTLHAAGFIEDVDWSLGNIIMPMMQDREIIRAMPEFYVATCPNCHEPILQVCGVEH